MKFVKRHPPTAGKLFQPARIPGNVRVLLRLPVVGLRVQYGEIEYLDDKGKHRRKPYTLIESVRIA